MSNNNSRMNRFFRDEAIENASSFEEARAIIVSRLNNLLADLNAHVPGEEVLAFEICRTHEDKFKSLMDLYAGYYSPCKVTDTVYTPRGQVDMNDVMLDFSEGFEEFIDSLEEKYVELIISRRRATVLLNKLLSIKLPFSRLLYYYYYKRMNPEEILEGFFISRATFYRIKSSAITALTMLYYPKDKDKGGSCEETA
jgi:hypothetical protein